MSSKVECFKIANVAQFFEESLLEDDDVLLDAYLRAYEEIMKFFQLMGSIFTFVSSDVRNKLDILYVFRNGDNKHRDGFTSIKSMILFETETDMLKDKNYVSGSRTLLRLHRGLDFFHEFLTRLQDLSDDEKAHNCCKSAYNDTLAKHHTFLIRKGAQVAMYAMPTKQELLNRVCDNVSDAILTLPNMLRHTRSVYDRTEKLYTLYNLHDLP